MLSCTHITDLKNINKYSTNQQLQYQLESTHRAQTSARRPSWMLSKVVFHAKIPPGMAGICQTAKFGEDMLNYSRAITRWRFPVRQFWLWLLNLTAEELIVKFCTLCSSSILNFTKIGLGFREMTTSETNEATNPREWQQTLLTEITNAITV